MIREIRLRNFKKFENETFETRNLTVFSGANSQGKSTVLQALALLHQSMEVRQSYGGVEVQLNGDWIQLGRLNDIGCEDREDDDDIAITLTFSSRPSFHWSAAMPLETTSIPEALFSAQMHYLTANRIGSGTCFRNSDLWVRQRNSVGTQGEFSAHFLALRQRQEISAALRHQGSSAPDLRSQLEAWLATLQRGIRVTASTDESRLVSDLIYKFTTEFGESDPRLPTHVGFGITSTLPIFLVTLTSGPESLVLIENPEAHLHPGAQRELAEFLCVAASSGVQIMLETHSDHILNGIRIAAVKGTLAPGLVKFHHLMTNEAGRLDHSQPELLANGRFDVWPKGFFDDWEDALRTILSRKPAQS